jgi:hypothetical protein
VTHELGEEIVLVTDDKPQLSMDELIHDALNA